MVLRCSLLGHSYGDPAVDREREERGSEVVLTVTEYEECTRCGDRNVISENTEVKSIQPGTSAPEQATVDSETEPASSEPSDVVAPETAETEIPDRSDDDRASTATPTETESESDDTQPAVPIDEAGDPIVDDGEILEDEPAPESEDDDRGHGEWPDSDDVGPPVEDGPQPASWPDDDQPTDSEQHPETVRAEPVAETVPDDSASEEDVDDAVIIDSGSDPDTDHETGGTTLEYSTDSTNEEPSAGGPALDEESPATEDVAGTGIESDASAPAPGESSVPDDVPTEFYCPQCEFVAPEDRGSLRTGDICPDCRKGYLNQRQR